MYGIDPLVRDSAVLVRVSHRRPVVGQFQSSIVETVGVHWFRGRSLPCVQLDCPMCQRHISIRAYGYAAVILVGQPGAAVLELPASAVRLLHAFRPEVGDLFGRKFRAFRTTERPNSAVEIVVSDKPHSMPSARKINVRSCLATLWEMPCYSVHDNEEDYTSRVRATLLELCHTTQDS